MIEYKIFIEGWQAQEELVKELYSLVLESDPKFHFIYEGDYVVIRASDSSDSLIISTLDENGVKFEVSNYVDSSEIVREYEDYFTALFHIYSLLSIQLSQSVESPSNLRGIYERTGHLLYAINTPNFIRAAGPGAKETSIEPQILGDITWGRSFYNGMREAYELHRNSL